MVIASDLPNPILREEVVEASHANGSLRRRDHPSHIIERPHSRVSISDDIAEGTELKGSESLGELPFPRGLKTEEVSDTSFAHALIVESPRCNGHGVKAGSKRRPRKWALQESLSGLAKKGGVPPPELIGLAEKADEGAEANGGVNHTLLYEGFDFISFSQS